MYPAWKLAVSLAARRRISDNPPNMSIFRLKTLIFFYRELAQMAGSGIDVVSSADILSGSSGSPEIRSIFKKIKDNLSQGKALSEAILERPDLFPQWQAGVIKAAESAGKLKEGLERVAGYLENDYEAQKNIIAGLAYPVVLLHVAIFLLPVAMSLVNKCCYSAQVAVILVPAYGSLFLIYFLRKLFFSYPGPHIKIYHSFILNIPVFGGLLKRINLARFIRVLKCLYDSGVNIIEAWTVSAGVCDNSAISERLLLGLPVIKSGSGITEALSKTKLFPSKTLGLSVAGEKSGSIGKALETIAVYSEKENELAVSIIVKTIPVFIYIAVASYIGWQIISFYNSYFNKILSY